MLSTNVLIFYRFSGHLESNPLPSLADQSSEVIEVVQGL